METVLGLVGMAVYMVVVVGIASGVTFLVVKLSPSKSTKEIEQQTQQAEADGA